ncbi:MAG: sigma-70 family RNA polymerase sigma factor [Pirellulaceae bacterium]|nr:sigma-70 family RNA polymerase sigma factor [Planctomycetaceae bacterium]MDG2384124.1 sigma-70 family RNA polymerase sigma factor [Pirellulaceae bacterium]
MTNSQTTDILLDLEQGDRQRVDELSDIVYDELRNMAQSFLRRERSDHPLQPTALVHEAFLRMADQSRVNWQGRSHFMAISAQAMRRILVDHARSKKRQKRSGQWHRVLLNDDAMLSRHRDEDVLAVNEALEKLEQIDPVRAKIVELRFFSGMSVKEVAEAMDLSPRTVERNWTAIRAWLRKELSEETDE